MADVDTPGAPARLAGRPAMEAMEWEADPSPVAMSFLDEKLDDALVAMTGHAESQPLGTVVRVDGRIVAGAHGLAWGQCCELLTLWVDEDYRHQGIASRLIEAFEADAARRGCRQVVLFTHFARPPTLYLRMGYEVAGTIPDYPAGSAAYWLRKSIQPVPVTP